MLKQKVDSRAFQTHEWLFIVGFIVCLASIFSFILGLAVNVKQLQTGCGPLNSSEIERMQEEKAEGIIPQNNCEIHHESTK